MKGVNSRKGKIIYRQFRLRLTGPINDCIQEDEDLSSKIEDLVEEAKKNIDDTRDFFKDLLQQLDDSNQKQTEANKTTCTIC